MRISIFFIMMVLMQISDTLAKKTAETPESSLINTLAFIFILCLAQDIKELFS